MAGSRGAGSAIPEMGLEEPGEVPVEFFQELMHVHHVAGGDTFASLWPFGLDSVLLPEAGRRYRFLSETAEGELGFLRVAVVHDGGDKVARVAIAALYEHGPNVRLAGDDLDVVVIKFTMAYNASTHALQDDLFDLYFGIHDFFLNLLPRGSFRASKCMLYARVVIQNF